MHARVNYVTFRSNGLDEVARMWPLAVAAYRGKGFAGGWFLLDRTSGESVSVVLFDNVDAARANESQGDFRAAESPFRALRLSEPDKHYYDVAASIAGNDGTSGFARLARPVFRTDAIDSIVAELPAHVATYRREPGFRGSHLMVDRGSGETVSMTLWHSEADCRANEASGAFQATVDPISDRIAVYPTRLYLPVAAVVLP